MLPVRSLPRSNTPAIRGPTQPPPRNQQDTSAVKCGLKCHPNWLPSRALAGSARRKFRGVPGVSRDTAEEEGRGSTQVWMGFQPTFKKVVWPWFPYKSHLTFCNDVGTGPDYQKTQSIIYRRSGGVARPGILSLMASH